MTSLDNGDVDARPQSLLEKISERRDNMRASERCVGDWVLANPVDTSMMNLAGLADAAGVSEPTVVRFCTAIGLSGFRAFKIELVRSLALGDPGAVAAVSRDDSIEAVVSKTVDRTISALDRVRRRISTEALEEAADILTQAREIIFIGAGTSGIVALDAQQKFPVLGVPCSAPLDFHEQYMAASMSGEGTVVVAISNSARTRTVVDVAQAAKATGGRVIAIVGDDGPLAQIADVTLHTSAFEDTEMYTPTVSRIAELVVIDILTSLVALRRPASHAKRVTAMKQALSRIARHV